MFKQFSALLMSIGKILPKVIKFCALISTFYYSLGNFYRNFDKRKTNYCGKIHKFWLLWVI